VWDSRLVLKRRVPRVLATGFLLALAVPGLAACRTSPNVAAYVGDEQVTVAELDAAVDDRLADPDIAASVKGKEDDFTRRVLTALVQQDVYAAAAKRYDVQVGNDEVRSRIDQLLASQDPDTVYAQLAQQGVSRQDVFESVRQQLVGQEIAQAKGKADALSESALRARYEDQKQSLAKVAFGYITVPDQATADSAVAQLNVSPASYAGLAAAFPGANTLPSVQTFSSDQIPGVLAEGIKSAAPNTAFATPVAQAGGVVVTFVVGPVVPSFEEARPDLEKAATAEVQKAATALVGDVRTSLHVRVNPRYGVLDNGKLVADDKGVVDILSGDAGDTPAG
jgi:hypothetical protein